MKFRTSLGTHSNTREQAMKENGTQITERGTWKFKQIWKRAKQPNLTKFRLITNSACL